MKTTDLITLKASITQGEWQTASNGNPDYFPIVNRTGKWALANCSWPAGVELEMVKANQQAIAITPQLIAEVIRLREALDKARRGFDYTVSSMAQGHTVSISSLQNCSALCRTALENT